MGMTNMKEEAVLGILGKILPRAGEDDSNQSYYEILAELRGHLLRAAEWANVNGLAPPGEWSCISSTLAAVEQGNVGLALTRWGDLSYSPNMPLLSPAAENWRAP